MDLDDFNPRPLAGATSVSLSASICVAISIHAPLRGRHCFIWQRQVFKVFQSTPPCGGDPTGAAGGPPYHNFNPRPLAGATVFSRGPGFVYVYFNPRPLAGATKSYNSVADLATISIHAPLRGRPSGRCKQFGIKLFQSTPPCGGDRTRT